MKKVCSLKKKLVTFGLAVCTFVTSIGVNECSAMNNSAEQNQNQQESWTVGGAIKWLLNRGVDLSVLYVAYRLGLLTYIFHHHESAGNIILYLSSLIGTGVVINKIKSIPSNITSNIKDEFSKKLKKRNELKEEKKKLKEKLAKNNKESWKTLGEEVILLPKKVVTAGATVASGAWTCAKVAAFIAKGIFYSTKGLYNFTYWLSD